MLHNLDLEKRLGITNATFRLGTVLERIVGKKNNFRCLMSNLRSRLIRYSTSYT